MNSQSYKDMPSTPGVYIMKNSDGRILYIGKAVNLRRRVSSYFQKSHDYRIEKLISAVKKLDYKKTDTGLEALILESELIKKYQPPFNILEKDDKSFLYVEITKEKFPRVLLVRGKDLKNFNSAVFGPFLSARSLKEAVKIIRRIFPFSIHDPKSIGLKTKACFDYQLGLCPGTCLEKISTKEYRKNIRNVKLFFQGKKTQILKSLKKEMEISSRNLEFEKAAKIKKQIFALKHIEDVAFISESDFSVENTAKKTRIEGYDISNISGTSAVGSMVVFVDGKSDKSQYRKFRIKTVRGSDDTGMLYEILERRFRKSAASEKWPLPDIILVDGGKGQVSAAKSVLREKGLKISILGIAKGPERKRNDIIGIIPEGVDKKILVQVRDEAHRFAVTYHRKIRNQIPS